MGKYICAFIVLAIFSRESLGGTFSIRDHHTEVDFNLTEIDDMIKTHQVEFKKNIESKIRDFECDISLSVDIAYKTYLMNGIDLAPQSMAIEDLHAICQKCLRSETVLRENSIPESSSSIYYAVSRVFPIQVDYYLKYNNTYVINAFVDNNSYKIELGVTLNSLSPFFNVENKGLLGLLYAPDRMSCHASNIAKVGTVVKEGSGYKVVYELQKF